MTPLEPTYGIVEGQNSRRTGLRPSSITAIIDIPDAHHPSRHRKMDSTLF
jgi:hypothetical protein